MANQPGRPIAPARKLVAAVLGTIAAFVMVFGLGLSSWAIVALGVAMLALAVALAMVNVVRRGARAWVAGTAQVKAVSEPPMVGAYGRAELQIMVIAPGLPVNEVLVRDPRVPLQKWPVIGDTLPVTVDVDDMRRVRINWTEAADTGADGDPPPPGVTTYDAAGYDASPYDASAYDTPAYDRPGYGSAGYDPEDFVDDDLLGDDPEPPPWATRDRQWGRGPDEPPPPPPPTARAGEFDEPYPDRGSSVVVRDTPAGPVLEGQVVEGQVVDQDAPPPPAHRPRRAPAEPAPSHAAASGGAPAGTATVTEEPPPAHRPSPRPRRTPAPSPETPDPSGTAGQASDGPAAPPGPTASAAAATAAAGATIAAASGPASAPEQRSRPSSTAPDPEPRPETGSAPRSETGSAPRSETGSAPRTEPDEIDLPLDGDPEPAPETTASARQAVDSGVIAAPATSAPAAGADAPVAAVPAGRGPWADLDGGHQPDEPADEFITAYPSARPGPSGAIHGVGLTVPVTDLARSVAFYRDLLGFHEIDSGDGSAVLASGDTRLVLTTADDLGDAPGHLVNLNLEVGDVAAVHRDLEAKGVEFVHGPRPVNRGGKLELRAATFRDPDGHTVAITQWSAIG